VLVVEDDPGIRALLLAVLGLRGHAVHEVERGDEALDAVRAIRPDVISLDLGLPGLDGMSVLRELKSDRDLQDIPVVVVTAWDDPARISEASSLGAADYVCKPFDADALVARIEAAIGA